MEDLPLAQRAAQDVGLAPVVARLVVFAEHALAGAGRVDHHPVEASGPAGRQPLRRLVEHQRIRGAPALQVAAQHVGPAAVNVVGHQQALAGQQAGDVGRFTAWRCAQIQHPLARLRRQQRGHGHRAGVLDVIQGDFVVGVGADVDLAVQREAFGAPGHGGERPGAQRSELLHGQLERVDAQRRHRLLVQHGQKRGEVLVQQRGHARHEGQGQGGFLGHGHSIKQVGGSGKAQACPCPSARL